MNLAMLLEMAAEGSDGRVAVGSSAAGLTAPALLQEAQRAAAMFVERRAEHVGLVDLNSDAIPVAMFGAALAGVPFAPVNYRLTDDKLASILRRLAPGVVVVGPDAAGRVPAIDGLVTITRDELLERVASEAAPAADAGFV